jgi:hypothetical protein
MEKGECYRLLVGRFRNRANRCISDFHLYSAFCPPSAPTPLTQMSSNTSMSAGSTSSRPSIPLGQSARNIQLHGLTLSAECSNTLWTASGLDLDSCLGNVDGSFQWGKAGFSLSAQNIRLNGTVLDALLRTSDGRWVPSQIDLSERITNIGGQLALVSATAPPEPQTTDPQDNEPSMCKTRDGSA